MLALYIALGLIALVCLILSSPVSVRFQYQEEPSLVVKVWGQPFTVLPRPEKSESDKQTASATQKEKPKNRLLTELETTFREDGIGAVLHWVKVLAGMIGRTVGRLLKAVTVKRLKLHMRVPGEEAADIATNYGKVCSAFFPLYGMLCTVVKVKKQDVCIDPDFLQQGGGVLVDLYCRISLWRVTAALIAVLWEILCLYITSDTKKTERKITNDREQ